MEHTRSLPESVSARIDHIKALSPAQRSVTPPVPRSAKLELTGRCDLGCTFCAVTRRPRLQADMPWHVYARIARELRDAGVEQLGLFYLGEPFLCEWLPQAIRYAKRQCGFPYVFVTSNGHAATPERVRPCMEAGLDSLKFAVNFSDPVQLEAIGHVPGSHYDRILHNIRNARIIRDQVAAAYGYDCRLTASSLDLDGEQRERMTATLDVLRELVDEHYWLPLLGARYHRDENGGTIEHHPSAPHKPLPCWPLFAEAHIRHDGHLSACCLDHSARFDVADVTNTPFAAAWASPAFQALRRAHLSGDVSNTSCADCIGY